MDVGRRIAAVVGLAIVVAVLTACTSGDLTGQPYPADNDPSQRPSSLPTTGAPSAGPGVGWNAEIAELSGYAQSDFEREAFVDGKISREEYDQAHELWLDCIEEYLGTEGPVFASLDRDSRGLYNLNIVGYTDAEGDPLIDEVVFTCEEGTTGLIAALFNAMAVNPENRNFEQLILECLVRDGVVQLPYTLEDYYNNVGLDEATGEGFDKCEQDPLGLTSDP